MKDPVRVRRNDYEKTAERATAEREGWEILPDEPVYVRGRLRGATSIGGGDLVPTKAAAKVRRQSKPKVKLPPAIPTPTVVDDPVADPTDDGSAVADTPEASS